MGSVTSMLQSSLEPILSPIGGLLADIGYFKFTIGFMWSIYLIDTYIDYRQYKCIKNSTYDDLNKLLKSHFPKEGFEKSQGLDHFRLFCVLRYKISISHNLAYKTLIGK